MDSIPHLAPHSSSSKLKTELRQTPVVYDSATDRSFFIPLKNLSTVTSLLIIVSIVGLVVLYAVLTRPPISQSHWRLLHTDDVSDGVAIVSLFFRDSNHGWALTPGELLQLNEDRWKAVLTTESSTRVFNAFTFVDENTAVIVGSQKKKEGYTGLILRTRDGGISWNEQTAALPIVTDIHAVHGLHNISFCNSDVGWAVGYNVIVKTVDGGQTWSTQRVNDDERLSNIECTSPSQAVAVGANGEILTTNDGGTTWAEVSSGTKDLLLNVHFVQGTGWIVGGNGNRGILLRSSDGGLSWRVQLVSDTENFFDVFFRGSHGWIVGENGAVWTTSDSGETWHREQTPTRNGLTSVYFLSSERGWAGGTKRTLLQFQE